MLSDCPFCRHEQATLHASGQETRSGQKRDIYECGECGCYYPRPRMDQKEALAWLLGADGPATTASVSAEPADPRAPLPKETLVYRLKRMLRPIGFPYDFRTYLRRRIPTGGTSLDIGTYDGRFLAFMEALGFDAHGLEPQDHAAQRARTRGLNVHAGAFPDGIPAELDAIRFDFVSLPEVICYFVDLRRSLAKVNAVLTPGGHVLVKCHQGNSRYYAATRNPFFTRFGDNAQAIPTLGSLRYWLQRSGFAVINVSGGVWPRTRPGNRCRGRWAESLAALRNRAGGLFLFGQPLFDLNEADVLVVLARKQREGGDA